MKRKTNVAAPWSEKKRTHELRFAASDWHGRLVYLMLVVCRELLMCVSDEIDKCVWKYADATCTRYPRSKYPYGGKPVACQIGYRSSGMDWQVKVSLNTETLPAPLMNLRSRAQKWYRVSTVFLLTSRKTEIAKCARERRSQLKTVASVHARSRATCSEQVDRPSLGCLRWTGTRGCGHCRWSERDPGYTGGSFPG